MDKYGNYPDLSKVKRVLVIKLRHLGDVLLSSPVFSNLKKHLPEAQIDAYIWKEAGPMLKGHSAITEIITYNREWKTLPFLQKMLKEIQLLWKIRRNKYDLVIQLTDGDRGAIATRVSGAPIRVGLTSTKDFKESYTHLVKPCPSFRHTVERDLDSVRRIGIFPNKEERNIEFYIGEEAQNKVSLLLKEEGLEEGKFVLLHPASRWRFKCLPPHLVAEVIDKLKKPVVLTGSLADVAMVAEILQYTRSSVVNLAGRLSLKELGACMQKSLGVITVDSVTLHMTSALQVPVVALFGPTSEKNWGPWQNPRARVIAEERECRPCLLDGCGGSKRSDCLWSLSPDAIIKGFELVTHPSIEEVAKTGFSSTGSLFNLNSLATKKTE